MKMGLHPHLRRSLSVAAAGILAVALAACTGHGGGKLPPDGVAFTGPATFGFAFSCEDKSTSRNSPTGQLRIQLAYSDHGSNLIGSSFSIHGIADTIDPVRESMICIGQNPPPDPNELIFLGHYWLTSSAPAGFPSTCPARKTQTRPLCRFEVRVRDNDMDRAASTGDYFQIALSSGTVLDDELDPAAVFYTRAGLLSGGNLTVD
jgi:hypothetical protein